MRNTRTLDDVKAILEQHPSARNSDFELIAFFAYQHSLSGVPFSEAVMRWQLKQLPPFETITRARRKLQEQYPQLRATETVRKRRAESEERHRDFYGQQKSFNL